jgi:AraC family transcriptional activator of pobA
VASQDISRYNFKDIFSVKDISFDKECVVSQPEQLEDYSIYWIKDGKGTYNIDFESYSFDGTAIFFLSPGQIFTIASEEIKRAFQISFVRDFYCIQTHDKEVSCNGVLFNNIYETPFVVPKDEDIKKLDFILEALIDEFKNEGTAQYDMLQSYLKQFIIHSVRIKKEISTLKDDEDTKLFKDFSLLVDVHFKTMHTVTDYADKLGVSPKSLTKHFQKSGATTPSDFIKNRIILEAKRMLLYTDNSIKHIAYDLGFNDPAYFTRFFTKAEKKSPKQFQKDLKT